MAITSTVTGNTDILAQAALVAEMQDVRDQTATSTASRVERRIHLTDRLQQLAAGRQELLRSADKALIGGALSAGMSFASAACQGVASAEAFKAAGAASDQAELAHLASQAPTAQGKAVLDAGSKAMEATAKGFEAASKSWDAAAASFNASGKLGEVYGQSGAYDQAAKLLRDKQAEVAQTRAQDDDQRANDARSLRDRELGRMKDLLDTVHQAQQAAANARPA